MAYPGYSIYPSAALYPGDDYEPQRDLAILPPETLEQLLTGSRSPQLRVEATDANGRQVALAVLGGEVTHDWDSAPNRTGTLSLLDDPYGSLRALLDPRAQNRVRVWFGVSGPRTAAQEFPAGVFVATSIDRDGQELTVKLADLAHVVKGRLLVAPIEVKDSMTVLQAVDTVLSHRFPGIAVVGDGAERKLSARAVIGEVGGDPWDALTEFLKAYGYRIFFDALGQARVERILEVLGSPVHCEWRTGGEGVIGAISSSLDGSEAPDGIVVQWANGVVVVPEDKGRLILWDGDETLLADASAAVSAGEAELALKRGMTESVSVTVWARYDLLAGHVVRIIDGDDQWTTRVTSVTFDLNLIDMSVKLADMRRA